MQVTQTGSGRRAERVPLDARIELRTGASDELLEADGLNVSIGGMAMRSPVPPAAGTRLECRFHCPPDGELVCAQGEVVWSSSRGPTLGTFGLRFVELDTKSATCLRRFVSPAGVREATRDDRRAATLSIDGLGPPVEAELKLADETRIVLEQRLGFLQLGRGVEVAVLGRGTERGRIASVELRHSHYDVPTIVYGVLLDAAPGKEPEAVPVGVAPLFAGQPEPPLELVRAQVAPRARRSERARHQVASEPFRQASEEPPLDEGAVSARRPSQPPNEPTHVDARPSQPPAARASQPPAARPSQPPSAWTSPPPMARPSRPPPVVRASQLPPEDHPSSGSAEPLMLGSGSPRTTMLGLDAEWARASAAKAGATEPPVQAPEEGAPEQVALAGSSAPADDDAQADEVDPSRDDADDERARSQDESDDDEEETATSDGERKALAARVVGHLGQLPLYVGRLVHALVARFRALTGRVQPVLREHAEALDLPDAKTRLLLHVARARGLALAGWSRVRGRGVERNERGERVAGRAAPLRMQRSTLPGLGPADDLRLETPRRVRIIAAALAVLGIALGVYAVAPRSGADRIRVPEGIGEAAEATAPMAPDDEVVMEVEQPAEAVAVEPEPSRKPRAKPPAREEKPKLVAPAPVEEPPDPALAAAESESAPLDVEAREPVAAGQGASGARFGAEEVPNGRTFTLRMDGPVTRFEAMTPRENGFTLRIPGRVAIDRASPISSAHSAVARAMILNRNGYAELTVDFLPGVAPRYQVLGKGDTLEITLERL